MSGRKRRFYTIQVERNKKTWDCETETMPEPEEIVLLVPQYPGDTSRVIVEEGSYVVAGQRIADSMEAMPLHSAVSGTVEEIAEVRVRGNDRRTAVRIVSDGKQKISEKVEIPEIETKKVYIDCIRRAGIFNGRTPAYIDFSREDIKTIYVNGLESEPVVTAGHRIMIEDAEDIAEGIALTMKYLEADKAVVCIAASDTEAAEIMGEAAHMHSGIYIKTVKDKYIPDNREILEYELTGEEDNSEVLFSDIRTMAQIGSYFRTGMPVISQKITVDGDIIAEPKNVLVPIGTRIAAVADFCGGYTSTPRKIIDNGTMTGRCFSSDRLPVCKDTKAIVAFEGKDSVMPDVEHCIRCGSCYRNCPEGLTPVYIAKAYARGDIKNLKVFDVTKCIGCGCCSYICPAKIPLQQICLEAGRMVREVEKDV